MVNKSKILASIIFPLVLGTSLFSNKIHMHNETLPAPISAYTRVPLYSTKHIKKTSSVYDGQEVRGQIKKQIQKNKLETELKNISFNSLNDYFKKNSGNINNLKARLYYQIESDKIIKTALFGNNLPQQNKFRFFDQGNIVLK